MISPKSALTCVSLAEPFMMPSHVMMLPAWASHGGEHNVISTHVWAGLVTDKVETYSLTVLDDGLQLVACAVAHGDIVAVHGHVGARCLVVCWRERERKRCRSECDRLLWGVVLRRQT